MRVVVTGATGFIGRYLTHALAARGDEVLGLSRHPERTKATMPSLTKVYGWRPTSEIAPQEAFDGADAVVNLAGERMAGRWTPKKKQAILDTRQRATMNLVTGMKSSGVRVLVSASALGYYGDRGDELLGEEAGQGDGFLAGVCQSWEQAARTADTRVVLLRSAFVVGRSGGFLGPLKLVTKLGLSGPLMSGRQWWSWIHRNDVVGLILHSLDHDDVVGPVNACAPEGVRQRDFARALAHELRRPAILPAPAFALKLLLGEFATELLSSRRMLPRVALANGYSFQYTALADALHDALASGGDSR